MNKGIDYGLGQTNIDKATGIRYGVISMHEVTQAWADSSEGDYGKPCCPECGSELTKVKEGYTRSYKTQSGQEAVAVFDDEYRCETCNVDIEDVSECYSEEAIAFTYEQDGYKCSQDRDDTDIFILKSPFYTRCQYCSPCAPGAGYIINTVEDGVKSYCFSHDWFEDNIAPYPVFRVEDDKEVKATRETVPCKYCAGQGKRSLVELAKVRTQTLEELEELILIGSMPSVTNFDPLAHTVQCWCCNGTGNVSEVVERIIGE